MGFLFEVMGEMWDNIIKDKFFTNPDEKTSL